MIRSRTERSAHRLTRRLALAGGGMLGAGALGALAAACSPPGGPASQGAGAGAALKSGTTIVYWNDQGGAYPDLMQRWGTALEQKSGVKVEATGGVQDYNNKLTAAFAAGSPPDVYRYLQEAIPLPAAVDRNMLLALDALVKRDH